MIRFIQGSVLSSDNKYMQYRLMNIDWSTVVTDWQGVDDEPTAGSENLVKSGVVYPLVNKLDDISRKSNNLFNKNDVTVGKYQPNNVYYLIDRAPYSASNFIPVEEVKTYGISANRQGAFFNLLIESLTAF